MRRYLARHHLGLLGVFLALGGTSYAAFSLPANSITTREVKNHSLLRKDFAHGQARRGKRGAPGLTGLTGEQGPTGAKGLSGARGASGPAGPQVASPAWHELSSGEFAAHSCVFSGVHTTTVWSNTSNVSSVAYYKGPFGVVHLKGVAVLSVGEVDNIDFCDAPQMIFTLPQGFRPESDQIFARWSKQDGVEQPGGVDVFTNGDVHVKQSGSDFDLTKGDGTFYSLDGITFRGAD